MTPQAADCPRAAGCAYSQPVMPPDDLSTDEDLMLAYRAGDAAAFDRLYARHKGGVFRYLLRLVQDRGAAEELFQDVWMNLIRARAAYSVQAKFTTYLYRVAHNRAIDHFRARKGGQVSLDDEDASAEVLAIAAPASADPAVQVEHRLAAGKLLALIEALPAAQREAFLLHEEGGMGVDEIAAATGVNRETAKSRLRYALAKLRVGALEYT
jgi:RNA polymerase sigma-70 factor (ECF subfamily)